MTMMAGFGAKSRPAKLKKKGGGRPAPADENCVCGSRKSYGSCCEPLHDGKPAPTPEALVRARFAAYILVLPDYLLSSQVKNTPSLENLDGRARAKRALAAEKQELISYMSSIDFSDLSLEEAQSTGDNTATIAFKCQMKSKGFRQGEMKSKFLDENDVTFTETSRMRKLGEKGWFYEAGDVDYDGKSLEDEFANKGEAWGRKELEARGVDMDAAAKGEVNIS
mmetsp:Transcript_27565/g.87268  ORF Transcript_27565/g.87268 Transcript_27565/m.87268 type:complete len:223 (+) Transcript_27565:146-814(+)